MNLQATRQGRRRYGLHSSHFSVCVSGLVSVITVLISALIPVFTDWRKSKQDEIAAKQGKEAAEIQRIDKTTVELLSHLSHFRHWEVQDIEKSSGMSAQQAYSELRAKHYVWEQTVWSRLSANERQRVRDLRKKFEQVHTPDMIDTEVSDFSEEILSLSHIATGRA